MGIFARVLKQILIAHKDDDFSHLGGTAPRSDPIWYPLRRLTIAPAVISRLKEAADADGKYATLSPDDLEYAMAELKLSARECEQLRAALLAHGVEMFVGGRPPTGSGSTAAAIASVAYLQLLSQYDDVFNHVRGAATTGPSDAPSTMDQVLALAAHATTLLLAQSVALERQQLVEGAYWLELAIAAYELIARVAGPLDQEFATTCAATATHLRAARDAARD